MSKAENTPTEEIEAVGDIRLVQLAGVAVGGLRSVVNNLRYMSTNAFNPEVLFPGERPEPLAIPADRPDVDMLRKSGYL